MGSQNRYSRIYCLPGALYVQNAPLLILDGELLRDSQTNAVSARLRLKNIEKRPIRSVRVKLSPRATSGAPLNGETIFEYTGLNAPRGAEIGGSQMIAMPNPYTQAMGLQIMMVSFEDGGMWIGGGVEWTPLRQQKKLEEAFDDPELVKQFRLLWGDKAQYLPLGDRDVWLCSCGAVNRNTEKTCHECGNSPNYRLEDLEKARDLRLEREREEAELAEKKRLARKKAVRRALIIAAVVIVVAAAAAGLTWKVLIPNGHYNDAVALKEAGQLEEAIEAFEALDGYRDSDEQIALCRQGIEDRILAGEYADAEALFAERRYDEAIEAFEALGDYSDSAARVEDVRNAVRQEAYEAAEALLNAGKLDEAEAAFLALGDYSDAAARLDDVQEARDELAYKSAEALLTSGRYTEAAEAFAALGDFRDAAARAQEAVDAGIAANYQRAENLFASGQYREAYRMYDDLENYLDSEQKAKQCAAVLARQAAASRQSSEAITWYLRADDMESAYPLMYDYVRASMNSYDVTTYNYLELLKDANYRDSAELYDKMYKVRCKIIFNTGSQDTSTNANQLNRTKSDYQEPYVHYILNGPPEATLTVHVVHETRSGETEAKMGDWSVADEYDTEVVTGTWISEKIPNEGKTVYYHRYSVYYNDELVTSATLHTTYADR